MRFVTACPQVCKKGLFLLQQSRGAHSNGHPRTLGARQEKARLYSLFSERGKFRFGYGQVQMLALLVRLPPDEREPSQTKLARTAHSLVTPVQVGKVVSAALRAAHLGSELYWRWACWKLSRSSCRCRCTWTSTDTECRPLCDAGRELGCGRDAQLVSEGMTPALSGLD